jgi:protease-3
MNMSINGYNGMELSISGFTDKQQELLSRALAHITPSVDADGFKQAVDRFVRSVRNSENQFPFRQLFGQLSKVINTASYSNDDLVAAAKNITLEEFQAFVKKVLANNQVRIFAFGNYNDADINNIVKMVNNALPKDRKTTEYARSKKLKPEPGKVISLQKDLKVADVAVLDLFIHPEADIRQLARANVLARHLRTQAFDKLRTEEQLAYAVGASVRSIEDYTGIAFYIQTPVKDVLFIRQRFDQFRKEYAEMLKKLTPEEFAQLKNSTLVGLKEKPKNLGEELSPLLDDWYQEKWGFDSKDKLIAAVDQVTLDDIKTFYEETFMTDDVARILIELRGSKFKDMPFSGVENAELISNLPEFHKNAKHQ